MQKKNPYLSRARITSRQEWEAWAADCAAWDAHPKEHPESDPRPEHEYASDSVPEF